MNIILFLFSCKDVNEQVLFFHFFTPPTFFTCFAKRCNTFSSNIKQLLPYPTLLLPFENLRCRLLCRNNQAESAVPC